MDNIFEIDNLSFSYKDDNLALSDVSLNIKPGEFVSIIGPNGCGKSTLVKLLNGVLLPASGSVKANGYLTTDLENSLEIKKNIAIVFQNPDNQIVATIVEEEVAFALENLGMDPAEMRRRVDEALEVVNMLEYKKHATYRLSGGQKQRVAIACALAMMPSCIIFDEATSMLDPSSREDIMNLITGLSKERGITIIFVTHFMEEACRADRIIVMNEGKIEIDGPPLEVFSSADRLIEIGMELPKTTQLIEEMKKEGAIDQDIVVFDFGDTVEFLAKALKENGKECQ